MIRPAVLTLTILVGTMGTAAAEDELCPPGTSRVMTFSEPWHQILKVFEDAGAEIAAADREAILAIGEELDRDLPGVLADVPPELTDDVRHMLEAAYCR